MTLVEVKMAGAIVFMLELTAPSAAMRQKRGVAAGPLMTAFSFNKGPFFVATKSAVLTFDGLGFHSVVSH